MKITMFVLTAFSAAGFLVFALLGEAYKAFAITFGTMLYHFAMRLAVGYAMLLVPRRFDADKGWFAERKWEKKLYAFLRVRRWKHKVPTYNPEDFDLDRHTLPEIIQTMCVSELVHEVIWILSFVPLLFAIPFGEFFVFLFTSLAAAAVDSVFVILQRFNRPKVVKLSRRMSARG